VQKRRLGRTGWEATILGFGGAYIGLHDLSMQEAEAVVNRALDLGVNYVDTATAYADSQEKIGQVMGSRRDQVFLSTKVLERTKAEAAEEIRQSLRKLQTDHVDLLQIHAASNREILEQIFADGGSLEAVVEAQRAGLTRFVGITSHREPPVLVEALRRFDFDTVLVPISMLDHFVDDFLPHILPIARERDMGVIGMKPLASTVLPDVEAALRWAFSQPQHVIIPGMSSIEHVERDVAVAESFVPLSEAEQAAMLEQVKPLAKAENLYWRK
jgi:aryl-alcohol dehydrogenase-like predicted oxidoreductase